MERDPKPGGSLVLIDCSPPALCRTCGRCGFSIGRGVSVGRLRLLLVHAASAFTYELEERIGFSPSLPIPGEHSAALTFLWAQEKEKWKIIAYDLLAR